jgi:hypothetical protein
MFWLPGQGIPSFTNENKLSLVIGFPSLLITEILLEAFLLLPAQKAVGGGGEFNCDTL